MVCPSSNKTLDFSLNCTATAYFQNISNVIKISYSSSVNPKPFTLSNYTESKKINTKLFGIFGSINSFLFKDIDSVNYFGTNISTSYQSELFQLEPLNSFSSWIILPRTEFRLNTNFTGVSFFANNTGTFKIAVRKSKLLFSFLFILCFFFFLLRSLKRAIAGFQSHAVLAFKKPNG